MEPPKAFHLRRSLVVPAPILTRYLVDQGLNIIAHTINIALFCLACMRKCIFIPYSLAPSVCRGGITEWPAACPFAPARDLWAGQDKRQLETPLG